MGLERDWPASLVCGGRDPRAGCEWERLGSPGIVDSDTRPEGIWFLHARCGDMQARRKLEIFQHVETPRWDVFLEWNTNDKGPASVIAYRAFVYHGSPPTGCQYGKAEAEGLEPPSGCPRRISSAMPYQLGLRLQLFSRDGRI